VVGGEKAKDGKEI